MQNLYPFHDNKYNKIDANKARETVLQTSFELQDWIKNQCLNILFSVKMTFFFP